MYFVIDKRVLEMNDMIKGTVLYVQYEMHYTGYVTGKRQSNRNSLCTLLNVWLTTFYIFLGVVCNNLDHKNHI